MKDFTLHFKKVNKNQSTLLVVFVLSLMLFFFIGTINTYKISFDTTTVYAFGGSGGGDGGGGGSEGGGDGGSDSNGGGGGTEGSGTTSTSNGGGGGTEGSGTPTSNGGGGGTEGSGTDTSGGEDTAGGDGGGTTTTSDTTTTPDTTSTPDPEVPTDPAPADPTPDPEVPTTPTGGAGGVGGPGGLNAPSVSLSSLPSAGAQNLAFVTLSQIPYTGFKAGTLTASLYWLMLILWSGVIAYIFFMRRVGVGVFQATQSFETGDIDIENDFEVKTESQSYVRESTLTAPTVAQAGLRNLPTNDSESVVTDAIVLETDGSGRSPRLILKRTGGIATQKKTKKDDFDVSQDIMSTDQAKIVHDTSQGIMPGDQDQDVKQDTETPSASTTHQPSQPNVSKQATSVVEVIHIITQGNTQSLVEMLQRYKAQHRDVSEILIQTLCELDRLYASRIGDREPLKDASIEDIFENWKDCDIERLIHMLSTGIDQNYQTQHTSAKMALLRALEYAQEIQNKS